MKNVLYPFFAGENLFLPRQFLHVGKNLPMLVERLDGYCL